MNKFLIVLIGIFLAASPALGADRVIKINELNNLGKFEVEEKWHPEQEFEIREEFGYDRTQSAKSKMTIYLWKNDRISVPFSFKIKSLNIPKVKLTFKATF